MVKNFRDMDVWQPLTTVSSRGSGCATAAIPKWNEEQVFIIGDCRASLHFARNDSIGVRGIVIYSLRLVQGQISL